MKTLTNILLRPALWLLLLCGGITGCVSDIDYPDAPEQGTLSLSFRNVSVQTETRSTPAQLGTPVAEDFTLTIVSSNGRIYYDGRFTNEEFNLPVGIYTVEAHYGDNPRIAVDAPYFCGSVEAEVKENEHVSAEITAKVANALVSVRYGVDEAEKVRFDRFYENYSVNVRTGNIYASITPDHPERSVYVRAGSTIELIFSGYLKTLGQQVSVPIELPEGVSYTLSAADHLIITLSLEPNTESAIVKVVKAELVEVDVEEKVSYDWLPCPVVSSEHKYVRGELVGTDLSITASFPDAIWEARIHQGTASGNVVRVLSGMGALTSTYQENPNWPYLPPGTYVATYRYYSKQGKAYNFSKTTTFTVPNADLTLTADAYTSYSKYEEGDISAANACERLTVYAPKVAWNVANTLLSNDNYSSTYTTSIAGKTATTIATKNDDQLADITEVPVSGNLYTLTITANFCGQSVSATKQVRITGLPVTFAPPSTATGWSNDAGTTDFESDHVRLGNYSWSQPHRIKNTTWINVPQGTYLTLDYDIALHRAAISTTANVKVGGLQLVEVSETSYGEDVHNSGAVTVCLATAVSEITCEGSYGSGATHTKVYKLHFEYGQ